MKKQIKLTKEVKQAIKDLLEEDQKLRYPDQQPTDSPQTKKCIELGLCNSEGLFFTDLPKRIFNHIDKLYL
jgi:hypothetical protein